MARLGASTASASGSAARPTRRPSSVLDEIKALLTGDPGARSRADGAGGAAPGSCRGSIPRCSTRSTSHQDAGRPTFIVSAAGDEIVKLIAQVLYMDGGIGTAYAVDDEGRFTGELGGHVHVRRGQGRGDATLRRRARRSTCRSPGRTRTRPPTCRCCARSAIRSSSTPTRSWRGSRARGAGG